MAVILKSQGGQRSDMPCGQSIAGPTWFEICINANWRDWWNTAVAVRERVIARAAAGASQAATADAVAWLREWSSGTIGKALALTRAASTMDATWSKDPGMVWSKGHFRDLVSYSVEGAEILKRLGGADLFTEADDDSRSLTALLIGGAAGVAAVLIALLVTK